MSDVTTWADGYGIWHAQVPTGYDQGKVARRAILDQLRQRGTVSASRVRVELISCDDQVAHYRENA
jgi:hypothetical protein